MKYTAIIREIVTRDIRVIFNAESKGSAKRIATLIAAHPTRYKEGFVTHQEITVLPILESAEPLTCETNDRIQKELRQ